MKLTIEFDSIAELRTTLETAVQDLAGTVLINNQKPAPAQKATEPTKPTPAAAAATEAPAELEMPTKVELRNTLQEVMERFGKDTLVKLLDTHGAGNIKELTKDEWPACYATAQKLIADDIPDGDDINSWPDSSGDDDDEDLTDDDAGGELEDVSVEDVKASAQKVAKKHGLDAQREILNAHGLNTARGINGAAQDVLNKIHRDMEKAIS